MSIKIAPVQMPEDCGIIFLLRDDCTGLRGAVQIIERPSGVVSPGGFCSFLLEFQMCDSTNRTLDKVIVVFLRIYSTDYFACFGLICVRV